MLNPDVIAAVKAAEFCRVVVYLAVRGWCGEEGTAGGRRRARRVGAHRLPALGRALAGHRHDA